MEGAEAETVATQAVADAVEVHDANLAAWMRTNGVAKPSAGEAARLRLLAERLLQQAGDRDFDGAVETWLQTQLGDGARSTALQRQDARLKIRVFFASL